MNKKIAVLIGSMILSASSFAIDNDVENIQALCALAQNGNYSTINAKGDIKAGGTIRLIAAGINGEMTLNQGNWNGLQQVLKKHQADDNKDYRACVKDALPYFKPLKTANTSNAKKSNTAYKKSTTKETRATIGNITGNQNVIGNTTSGDMTINFGRNNQ